MNKLKMPVLYGFIFDLTIIIVLTLSVIIAYRNLPGVFYLHDAWREFAEVNIYGPLSGINNYDAVSLLLGKGRVLGTIINNIFLYYFPFQNLPFITIFLIFHAINSILLYKIIYNVSRNRWLAIISGIFFATTSRHEQALSWIEAGIQILLSTTFILASILILQQYLLKRKVAYLTIGILFSYIAFLFKESSIFYIILMPIFFLIWDKYFRMIVYKNLRYWYLLLALGMAFIYGFYCLFGLYISNTENKNFYYILFKSLFNSAYYPFISLGQYFIPYRLTYRIAEWILNFNYKLLSNSPSKDSIIHFILSDYVSGFISILILAFITVIYIKNTKSRRLILLTSFWFVLSLSPTAFHLINRYDSYIDSRYLYITTPAASIMFGLICVSCLEIIKKLPFKYFYLTFFIFLLLLFFVKQISVTNREVRVASINGIEMSEFVKSYKSLKLIIPDCPIFFVTGNRNYYYDNNKLPFQLGAGYIMLVMNYKTGKIDKNLISERYLQDFGSQGFVRLKSTCYGYFWDQNELLKLFLTDGSVNYDQLIALRWNSDTKTVYNIKSEISNFIFSKIDPKINQN
jgi:hypothetical protein